MDFSVCGVMSAGKSKRLGCQIRDGEAVLQIF